MTGVPPGGAPRWARSALRDLALAAIVVVAVAIARPATVAETGTTSSSPAPTWSSSLSVDAALEGLTTEPVAPGIWRVLADDAGHRFVSGRVREVEAGPNGSVWVAQGRRLVKLDQPGAIEPRVEGWQALPRRLSVDAGGVLWAQEDGGAVISESGGAWRPRGTAAPSVPMSLAVSGGTVWRLASTAGAGTTPRTVERHDEAGWSAIEAPALAQARRGGTAWDIAMDGHGRLWLAADQGPERGWLAAYESGAWLTDTAPGDPPFQRVRNLDVGKDGVVWLLAERRAACDGCDPEHVLAMHDGVDWQVYGAAEGMPQEDTQVVTGWSPSLAPPLLVDDHGAVWFSLPRVGLFRFYDGVFERVGAPGLLLGALDLSLDPHGHVWVASLRGALLLIDAPSMVVSAEQ